MSTTISPFHRTLMKVFCLGDYTKDKPTDILPLNYVSDHLPLPITYYIRDNDGQVLDVNVVSWNVMSQGIIRTFKKGTNRDYTKKAVNQVLKSLQFYIGRLLKANSIQYGGVHILMFQEYSWEPSFPQLAPRQFLGSPPLNNTNWGIVHGMEAGPLHITYGLMTYYNKRFTKKYDLGPYFLQDVNTRNPGGKYTPAPFNPTEDIVHLDKGITYYRESPSVLILCFNQVRLVLQNVHFSHSRPGPDRYLHLNDNILNYFKPFSMSEVVISDELRHDEAERSCTETAVSFIGDFNYSILDRLQLEDLEGFSAFNNYIQPENSGHADEKMQINLWKHSFEILPYPSSPQSPLVTFTQLYDGRLNDINSKMVLFNSSITPGIVTAKLTLLPYEGVRQYEIDILKKASTLVSRARGIKMSKHKRSKRKHQNNKKTKNKRKKNNNTRKKKH